MNNVLDYSIYFLLLFLITYYYIISYYYSIYFLLPVQYTHVVQQS